MRSCKIFNKEFVERGYDPKCGLLYKEKDSSKIIFVGYDETNDIYSVRPYDWLSYNKPNKVWTENYGEVDFIECSHNFIKCLADNEIEVVYSANGHSCWWSEEFNCYRFDDETPCLIWPSKDEKYWKADIEYYEEILD